MNDWRKKDAYSHSVKDEYDVSQIDQDIFDDPVKLLEYLENNEPLKSSKEIKQPVMTYTRHREAAKERSVTKQKQSSESQRNRTTEIYGYTVINGKIEIQVEEAEAVRVIIDSFDSGSTISQLQYKLYNTQYRTRYGKHFYAAAIKNIIDNRKIYEGQTGLPPILSKDPKERINKSNYQPVTFSKKSEEPKGKMTSVFSDLCSPKRGRQSLSYCDKKKMNEIISNGVYNNADDFVKFIKGKGATVIDNRAKDGCLWILSEPHIDKYVVNTKIKGRSFRLTAKSRALGGKPGWYY